MLTLKEKNAKSNVNMLRINQYFGDKQFKAYTLHEVDIVISLVSKYES